MSEPRHLKLDAPFPELGDLDSNSQKGGSDRYSVAAEVEAQQQALA